MVDQSAPLHVGAAGSADKPPRSKAHLDSAFAAQRIVLTAPTTVAAIGTDLLRRYPIFRNDGHGGVTLGSPPAVAWPPANTIVFVWPIISGTTLVVALWPDGRHY